MIQIIRQGVTIFETPANVGATCVCRFMEDEYIELPFSVLSPIHFEIGDYVDLADTAYDDEGLPGDIRKKYVVTERQVPAYNTSTGGYDWTLRLRAYYWAWNLRILKFRPRIFAQEASWGLTDRIGRFLDIVADNIDAYGFGSVGYSIDSKLQDYNINLSFEGTGIIDALRMICSKVAEEYSVDCEWWVEETEGLPVIHIGRCEEPGQEVITNEGSGPNAESITWDKADVDYANRLIVFGGTQNISARYRKDLLFQVSEAAGDVIADNAKTELSPSMFPVSQVEREGEVSFPTSTRYNNSDYYIDDYGPDHYSRKTIGSITPTATGLVFSYQFMTDFQYGIYDPSTLNGEGAPNTETTEALYKYFISWARVRLLLVRNGTEIEIDNVEYKPASWRDYKDYAVVTLSGSTTVVRTELTEGAWDIVIERDFRYTGNMDSGIETENLPVGKTIAIFDTYAYRDVAVSLYTAYRVHTRIIFETGNLAGRDDLTCYINKDYKDILSDAARRITVEDVAVGDIAVGDVFTLPDIIKGKVPSGYFSARINDSLVNGIVQRNLMLPASFEYNGEQYVGKNYIDIQPGMAPEQIVEKVVVFDKIFPKQRLSVEAVGHYTSETEEEEAGNDTGIKGGVLTRTHYYWQFLLTQLDFTEDCLIEGVDLGLRFETGKLAGLSFKAAWRPAKDTIGNGDDSHRWEIVNNEDYGIELPNSLMHPEPGDGVIITGWNCEAMDGENTMIADAENELLEEAKKMAGRIAKDPHTYHIGMMSGYITDYPAKDYPLRPGRMLTIANAYMFADGQREVRLIGYELNLDRPYDTPVLICGEKLEKSNIKSAGQRLDDIENGSVTATPYVQTT